MSSAHLTIQDLQTASESAFHDLEAAFHRRDPNLVSLFLSFIQKDDPALPPQIASKAQTLSSFQASFRYDYQLRRLPRGEPRMLHRKQKWDSFLQQKAPLPPRLSLPRLLHQLYEANDEWSRQTLFAILRAAPFRWGFWRGFKQLFKIAAKTLDLELFGVIAARIDIESASSAGYCGDVSLNTLKYLRRRGWRLLRRIGRRSPGLYPAAALEVMRWYPDWSTSSWYEKNKLERLWILNHILFHHQTRSSKRPIYGRGGFDFNYSTPLPTEVSRYRAFPDTWKDSSEPLLHLLSICQSNHVAQFAVEILQTHFRTAIRELPIERLIALGRRPLPTIQRFVKDLIEGHPSWQKSQFSELGLHSLLVDFFLFSTDESVRKFAISYAREYASSLPVQALLRFLRTSFSDLHSFALNLLNQRDPRTEIGLQTLQELLLLSSAFDVAKRKLHEGFRPSEISLAWFEKLLLSSANQARSYAVETLERDYPSEQIQTSWLQGLLRRPEIDWSGFTYGYNDQVPRYALKQLEARSPEISKEWLKEALLHSSLSDTIQTWIFDNKIPPKTLDVDWFRLLIDPDAWAASPWVKDLRSKPDKWLSSFDYPEHLRSFAFRYLRDTKRVSPEELSLDWLLGLMAHPLEVCRDFARSYLFQYFDPKHFATPDTRAEAQRLLPQDQASIKAENPWAGKSFLFTGTLNTLTRAQAEDRVTQIDGVNAASVTKDLHFLVVGDKGSPLYSEGKKGSKQVKAEQLQAKGAPIQIISETDWLRMISEGAAAKADIDPTEALAGFLRLFQLATSSETPSTMRRFAIDFLQARHPVLGPSRSGQPLEGHQVIPRDLFTSDRFLPLLEDERTDIQQMAVSIARFDLRRWKVPASAIFKLCESPQHQARRFALEALQGPTSEDTKEAFTFRPDELDPELVFALTESRRKDVRQTGLQLIARHYTALQADSLILRLIESADREVRSEAVRILWMRYHSPEQSRLWKPRRDLRTRVPASKDIPASPKPNLLLDFFKTVLFGLPPGRLEKRSDQAFRLWASSKGKTHLIALIRDLSLRSESFARDTAPLLQTFLTSAQKTEARACLTALTQIRHRWGIDLLPSTPKTPLAKPQPDRNPSSVSSR